MRCFLNRVYDRFKQTKIASILFFSGGQFKHFGPIERTGTVVSCPHGTADGDCCFDIQAPDLRWHCEVTPCASDDTKAIARRLHLNQTVLVAGTETLDDNHHIGPVRFKGGGNEIHPVTSIEVLS